MEKYEGVCLSTQKYTEMGAAESSEKLAYPYQTTQRHSPKYNNILIYCGQMSPRLHFVVRHWWVKTVAH